MANTADFKNGLYMKFNGDLFTLVSFQHVKPGKGGAFVRTKMKSLTNGRVIENTFTAGEKIDLANIERRPHQFLYNDEEGYHFMHEQTYEQIAIKKDLITSPDLLKEGQYVEMLFDADNETALTCELPPFVTLEVTYTEPGVKGDTASSNSLKKATVETGATVMIPLFIEQGTRIKIDTRDGSYSERAKD